MNVTYELLFIFEWVENNISHFPVNFHMTSFLGLLKVGIVW